MPDGSGSHYDAAAVARFFDAYGEREWERLVQDVYGEVSLHVHRHILEQHVARGQRVLEIGAGAGRFTQILAGLGARIVVGDISPGQLALNEKYAAQYGFAEAVEAWLEVDICDLAPFGADEFDRVVAYGGPFSYVLDARDRALAACQRVLRADGLLLLSVMSLWGSAHVQLPRVLETPPAINRQITDVGDILPGMLADREQFFHLFRARELRAWLEGGGFEIVALSASGCLTAVWGEALAPLRQDAAKWQELLRMEVEACAEEGALDMGTHIIAVARKRAQDAR